MDLFLITLVTFLISTPTVSKVFLSAKILSAYRVTKLVFPTLDYPSSNIFAIWVKNNQRSKKIQDICSCESSQL
jgi:hypothetical protein